jgi:hypothetical protein
MSRIQRNLVFFLGALFTITLLAVIWANISGSDDVRANFARWGLGAVVLEAVVLFGLVTRVIFRQPIYTITLAPPTDMPGFNVSRISWDREHCIALCAGKKFKINPVLGAMGASFEVRLPPSIFEKITDTEPVELQLVDRNGHRWEVRPFFVFQRPIALSYLDKREQVIATYGGA